MAYLVMPMEVLDVGSGSSGAKSLGVITRPDRITSAFEPTGMPRPESLV